jgi:hypothetical protein
MLRQAHQSQVRGRLLGGINRLPCYVLMSQPENAQPLYEYFRYKLSHTTDIINLEFQFLSQAQLLGHLEQQYFQ